MIKFAPRFAKKKTFTLWKINADFTCHSFPSISKSAARC